MNQYYSQWNQIELNSMHGIEFEDEDHDDDHDDDQNEDQVDHEISLWSLGMSERDFM
jgi:hypothetical protein